MWSPIKSTTKRQCRRKTKEGGYRRQRDVFGKNGRCYASELRWLGSEHTGARTKTMADFQDNNGLG